LHPPVSPIGIDIAEAVVAAAVVVLAIGIAILIVADATMEVVITISIVVIKASYGAGRRPRRAVSVRLDCGSARTSYSTPRTKEDIER
jgi:hypothetical protein